MINLFKLNLFCTEKAGSTPLFLNSNLDEYCLYYIGHYVLIIVLQNVPIVAVTLV